MYDKAGKPVQNKTDCRNDSPLYVLAERKGLEPSASGVTGRRYNRLNYRSGKAVMAPEKETATTRASSMGKREKLQEAKQHADCSQPPGR